MKINEVSVWKARKIQIEQYEPLEFAYGMKAELTDKDTPERVRKDLEGWIDSWINLETLKWKSPRRAITAGKKMGMYGVNKDEDVPFTN